LFYYQNDEVIQMVRRRKAKTRTVYRTAKKTRRKKSYGGGVSNKELMGMTAAAVGYGFLRGKLSSAITPLTSKIPLGNITDEVVLGMAGYFLAKKSKNKMLKNVGKAALLIEGASIGVAIAEGSVNMGGGSSSSAPSFR